MKRFIKVTSKDSRYIHIKMEDHVAEGMTKCGRPVTRNWLWFIGMGRKRVAQLIKPRCPRCFS